MTTVQKVDNNINTKRPLLTPKTTGYLATGALLLTTARAFSNTKTVKKSHKILGYLTLGLTLLHVGLVEYLHYKYKKM